MISVADVVNSTTVKYYQKIYSTKALITYNVDLSHVQSHYRPDAESATNAYLIAVQSGKLQIYNGTGHAGGVRVEYFC